VDPVDARVQVLLAEYEFVTGLIKYYREVELRALAANGLVLTAVAAAIAAIESADTPNRSAQSLLLSIGAWVPSVLLLIVIMAKARGMRAVIYVRERLRERAASITGDDELLEWETLAAGLTDEFLRSAYQGRSQGMARWVVGHLLRGTPIILAITASSAALAVAGAWIAVETHDWEGDEMWISFVLGASAAVAAAGLGVIGIAYTNRTDVGTRGGER
jgi:hypothetical protein